MRSTVVAAAACLGLVASLLSVGTGPASAVDPACDNPPQPTAQIPDPSWAQGMYDAPEKVWPFSTGTDITVAVVGTGVDSSHPQLSGRVLAGYDVLRNTPEGDVDCTVNGTPLASIIVAKRTSGIGFYGLAPNARILPIRVSDKAFTTPASGDEQLEPSLVAAGIDVATKAGVQVINVTEVLFNDDPRVAAAVKRALSKGIVIVAPVGDAHASTDLATYGQTNPAVTPFPASYDGVIGVGAVSQEGLRASTSQVGTYVDLVAPGVKVVAAGVGGQTVVDGTAVAASFVAATAALLLARSTPKATGIDRVVAVTDRLLATASPASGQLGGMQYGAGTVDPYRSLTEPITSAPPAEATAYVPPPRDPVAEAAAAQQERSDNRALLFTVAVVVSVFVAFILLVVVPRGGRRRWRTGLATPGTAVGDDRPEFVSGEALFRPPPPP